MAQSAPSPPIRMGMRISGEGAHSGLSAGRTHSASSHLPSEGRGGGGAGTNPITKALGAGAGDEAGFVPTQDVPIRGLGTAILNLALHPTMVQRAEEEQTRLANYKQNNPDHAAAQDAADTYMRSRGQGGSNTDILNRVFAPDSEGHIHFANPTAFSTIMGLHGAFAQQEARDQASAPPSIQKIGGYDVFTSGGRATVLKPQSAGAGKFPGKTFVDGQGNMWFAPNEDPTHLQRMGPKGPVTGGLKYDAQGNVLPPTPGTTTTEGAQPSEGPGSDIGGPKFGAAAKSGKLTTAEEADIKGVEQFATSLRNYEPVAGSNIAITGALAHAAPYLPFSIGKDFKALEEAHGQLQASVTALANSGNLRLKQIAGAVMGLVPPLGSSQDYAQNFAVPGMRDKLRTAIGAVNEDLSTKGIPIPPTLAQLTEAMGASPSHLATINGIRDKMTTAPGSLTNQEVQILNEDNLAYHTLNKQQSYALQSQLGWRGFMTENEVAAMERRSPGFKRVPTQAEDPKLFGNPDPAMIRAGITQQKATQAAIAQASPLAPSTQQQPPTQQAPGTIGSPLAGPSAPPPLTAPQAVQQSGMPKPDLGTRQQLNQQIPSAGAPIPPPAATAPIPPPQPQQSPSPGMAAPIPPAAGMAPQPQRQSFLDQINPIGAAMAGEPPMQAALEVPGNAEAEILAKQPLVDETAGRLPSDLANVRATAALPPAATAVIPPKERESGDQSE